MQKGDPAILRKNIKTAREKAGLSQVQVVEKLLEAGIQLTQPAYSDIEIKGEYFNFKTLTVLSVIFDIDICYFLVEHPDAASAVAEGGEDEN